MFWCLHAMNKQGFIGLLCCMVLSAQADGLGALAAFLKNTQVGRAEFTQIVTAPVQEGRKPKSKTSTGVFEFQRPSHFRFDYKKPFEQTLVADGHTLWLYDRDLNQVTARSQAQVLGNTPVALVASAPDLKALQADFVLTNAPDHDDLSWVNAMPKAHDGSLKSVSIGFRGEQLAVLDVQDNLGQRSVLRFGEFQVNPGFAPNEFQFKPPPGADLLKQ
jgi:outer membrane lipoprotein carrier protein